MRRKGLFLFATLAAVVCLAVSGISPRAVSAESCTATGFYRDGINLTAAVVNPASSVTGVVDATGCNIGVYFGPGSTGELMNAEVYGANYFGVAVQQGQVDVLGSQVHDIGENPLNGSQHGIAIYYATVDSGSALVQPACTSGTTSGSVTGNTISAYQKGGIVANCTGTSVSISGNTVTGEGPVDYIAQNGVQVSRGATGSITSNSITGNQYTGANQASSAGILIYGGCGDPLTTHVQVMKNTLTNNDVGVWFFNADPTCSLAPSTQTQDKAIGNTITNEAVTNTTGDGPTCGYQAGISDSGNHDLLQNNSISGDGYMSASCPPADVFPADTSFASAGARLHNSGTP